MMRKERAYDPPSSYFEGQKIIIEMVKSNAVMPKKKPSSSSDLAGFGNLQAMNLLTTKQANANDKLASKSKWKLGNTNEIGACNRVNKCVQVTEKWIVYWEIGQNAHSNN